MMSELENFFRCTFFERLGRVTGLGDLTYNQVKEICSTVYWMQQSNIPLSLDLNEQDLAYCEAIVDTNLFAEGALGNEHSWHLQTAEKFKLFEDILS